MVMSIEDYQTGPSHHVTMSSPLEQTPDETESYDKEKVSATSFSKESSSGAALECETETEKVRCLVPAKAPEVGVTAVLEDGRDDIPQRKANNCVGRLKSSSKTWVYLLRVIPSWERVSRALIL